MFSVSTLGYSGLLVGCIQRPCAVAHCEGSERTPASIPVPDTSNDFIKPLPPDWVAGAVRTSLIPVQGVREGHHALTARAAIDNREIHLIARLAFEERFRQFLRRRSILAMNQCPCPSIPGVMR